jgi:hypothetical protein
MLAPCLVDSEWSEVVSTVGAGHFHSGKMQPSRLLNPLPVDVLLLTRTPIVKSFWSPRRSCSSSQAVQAQQTRLPGPRGQGFSPWPSIHGRFEVSRFLFSSLVTVLAWLIYPELPAFFCGFSTARHTDSLPSIVLHNGLTSRSTRSRLGKIDTHAFNHGVRHLVHAKACHRYLHTIPNRHRPETMQKNSADESLSSRPGPNGNCIFARSSARARLH